MDILRGSVKNYLWGTTDRIPALLGQSPTGEPCAEYWLGAHPAGPATVDGVGLDVAIAADPALLGDRTRRVFGDRLPFLMKLLSADRALSLQLHPTAEQARDGYAREEAAGVPLTDPTRTYKDDWPKPEILCALEPFEALYGFRAPERSAAVLCALGGPLAARLADTLESGTPDVLPRVVLDLLGAADTALVDELVAGAAAGCGGDDPELVQARDTIDLLGRDYPGDPGIVVALLMNRLRLAPYEALYVPAGVLHAYLSGTGVEVMASSDNVVRGGLTAKHIDRDGLVALVDPRPCAPVLVPAEDAGTGIRRYRTPAPHFALWCVDPAPADRDLPGEDGPRVFLTVHGGAVLTCAGVEHHLDSGQAVFIAAGERVAVRGEGTGFLTSVADEQA